MHQDELAAPRLERRQVGVGRVHQRRDVHHARLDRSHVEVAWVRRGLLHVEVRERAAAVGPRDGLALARRLGEMQARMMQIDSLGERVAGLAGLNPSEVRTQPGSGGALVGPRPLDLGELGQAMDQLDRSATERVDWLTVIESRLFDQTIQRSLIPTELPVKDVELGSRFGLRIDPLTGQQAMHTGLDFPAEVGTPIVAAAGGVVQAQEVHPAYGHMVEIDHGNNIATRYAHASRVLVKKGDIVKRGDLIAEVGNTGRSTGPHLHFEVLVSGVPQNPARFLAYNPTVANVRAQAPPQRH